MSEKSEIKHYTTAIPINDEKPIPPQQEQHITREIATDITRITELAQLILTITPKLNPTGKLK